MILYTILDFRDFGMNFHTIFSKIKYKEKIQNLFCHEVEIAIPDYFYSICKY